MKPLHIAVSLPFVTIYIAAVLQSTSAFNAPINPYYPTNPLIQPSHTKHYGAISKTPTSSTVKANAAPLAQRSSPSLESLSLLGFVRGHKCLVDDTAVENGNIALLLRGADSSQRLLYPLELETNKLFLKGAEAAYKMFELGDEAVNYARNVVYKKFPDMADDKNPLKMVFNEDIPRYHRLLQYAVAAALKSGFVRPAALSFVMELYNEVGMNYEGVELAIRSIKEYYAGKISPSQWTEAFEPAWSHLYSVISDMRNHKGDATASKRDVKFEAKPEEGTLTPLMMDLRTIDIAEFPESDRKGIEELRKKLVLA